MLDNLQKYNVILASNSPRRRALLSELGVEFSDKTLGEIDETYPDTLKGKDVALFIANKKAQAYHDVMADNDLIITADTIVCIDDEILGKPRDVDEARNMLKRLSGNEHTVVTAVAIATKEKFETFAVSTSVRFDNLTDEIIDHYVKHFKPFDKAGSYGIQEWIGYVGVTEIKGSFFNVIGLPVQRLFKALQNF